MEDVLISGVTANKSEAKVTVCDVPDKPGVAAKIFSAMAKHDVNVDMIIQNVSRTRSTDVSFTVPERDLARTIRAAGVVAKKIKAGRITQDKNVAKISVVGIGMRSHSGVAARMFEALADAGVNIEMISTSEIKISCVVKKSQADRAVRAIHKKFKLGKK